MGPTVNTKVGPTVDPTIDPLKNLKLYQLVDPSVDTSVDPTKLTNNHAIMAAHDKHPVLSGIVKPIENTFRMQG